MSLDVYLKAHVYAEVYQSNITHNLNAMAEAAGIYYHLWRPEEIGIKKASELIKPLSDGLLNLKENRKKFEKYNPENGWGSYEGLVEFVEDYICACEKNPDADIEISR